jgi:hypothetical protein
MRRRNSRPPISSTCSAPPVGSAPRNDIRRLEQNENAAHSPH